MTTRESYPAGVPCWVDNLVPDPEPVKAFYGAVFGWDYSGPGPMPDGGGYYVARVAGDDVAGIGSVPPSAEPFAAWTTHVSVDSADATVERIKSAGGSVLAGPFDAPPAGRAAVVSDPTGAMFGVWEAGSRQGAQRINEPSAWAMSMLQSSDPEAANRFYGEVFGWEAWSPDGGIVLYRRPGYVGGVPEQPVPRDVVAAMIPAEAPAPSAWTLDFWTSDADGAAAAAASHGGRVLLAPHDVPMFRRAVLADPHGAVFSVSQKTLT